jgi:hypothetical protein
LALLEAAAAGASAISRSRSASAPRRLRDAHRQPFFLLLFLFFFQYLISNI